MKKSDSVNRILPAVIWCIYLLLLSEFSFRLAGFMLSKRDYGKTGADADYVILALGESTTAAETNNGGFSWPRQLEQILNNKSVNPKFRVINGGVTGTNTAFILARLNDNIEKYKPDFVITMMGINDGTSLIISFEETPYTEAVLWLQDLRTYKVLRVAISEVTSIAYMICMKLALFVPNTDYQIKKYVELGDHYYGNNDMYHAQKMYQAALRLDPEDSLPYTRLEEVYLDRAMFGEYEKMYQNVPNSSGKDWVYIGLGRLYLSEYNLYKAEEAYKKAITLYPSSEAYHGLGQVYLAEDKLSIAEMLLNKSLEYENNSYETYAELGKIHYSNNDFREAEKYFLKSLELNHGYDLAYNYLMRIYEKTGAINPKIEEHSAEAGYKFGRTSNEKGQITSHHYRLMYSILKKKGIKLAVMQYPTLKINPLINIFPEKEDILFISNENNFREALRKNGYDYYFVDSFGGTFGHATKDGNRMIAEKAAEAILNYWVI